MFAIATAGAGDRSSRASPYYSAALSLRTDLSDQPAPRASQRSGRVARNTALFSIGTAISRVAGLAREIVAASFFGTSGAASAYALAYQIPSLFSNLVANAALSAAFVPVFTDLLQQGRKREASALASALLWLILIVVGALTALFILLAGVIMPLFTGSGFSSHLNALTVGLAQVMFPVVLLLGLNSLFLGILQSYERFGAQSFSPAVWNVVIIIALVALRGSFAGDKQIYALAIAVLIGTVVQLGLAGAALGRIDIRLGFSLDWRNPRVRHVLLLMFPVTIGLGIMNLDQLINAAFGTLVSKEATAAIERAFRIYMLPQGMFSVAVTTVLFPALSRMAARRDLPSMRRAVGTGMRQINLLLIPSATLMIVLTTPIVRLVFERGHFTAHSTRLAAIALFWFAFALPFSGLNLLLTRTFFAVQRPWIPTKLAAVNIVADLIASAALYRPLGIAGLVIGTLLANVLMSALQLRRLRAGFRGRLEGAQTTMITARIILASALLGGVAWLAFQALEALLGRSLPAQLVSVGGACGLAVLVYARAVLLMRVPEAHQVRALISGRMGALRGA